MTVPIATRRSWGAQYDDGDLTLTGLALEVFAHHTVTAQLPPDASVEDERAQMRSIEATGHSRFATPQAPNFGISYNVLIFPSGRAYQGVSWNRRGAHTDGRNSTVRSICFVGNYEEHEPTAAQLATASAIYAEGKGKWWAVAAPLRGHRDLKPTACPGKHVYAQLPAIAAGQITQEEDMSAEAESKIDDLADAIAGDITDVTPEKSQKISPREAIARVLRINRQLVNTLAEQAKTDSIRHTANLERQKASAARETALLAAVTTLANSAGIDQALVLDTLNTAVRETLRNPDFEIVLTPKES